MHLCPEHDWIAEEYTKSEGYARSATVCDECQRTINKGDWRCTIQMREYSECQICEDQSSPNYIDATDTGIEYGEGDTEQAKIQLDILNQHTCDFGETFSYFRCIDCDKVLHAFTQFKSLACCSNSDNLPALGKLAAFLNTYHKQQEYVDYALKMFSELDEHFHWLGVISTACMKGKNEAS